MGRVYELSKAPIVVGLIASVLYIVDGLLSQAIDLGRGFMWVAFVAWTISFSMNTKDKVKLWIGHWVGFLAAVGMIYFSQIFDVGVLGIGIAGVIGVFLFNALVMYFDNFKKFWLDSITGIFMGIFLTFSGLGVGLSPDSWGNASMLFGILLLYSLIGCVCAFLSVYFINKWKSA